MLYIYAVITRTTTKKNINNMIYSKILHVNQDGITKTEYKQPTGRQEMRNRGKRRGRQK